MGLALLALALGVILTVASFILRRPTGERTLNALAFVSGILLVVAVVVKHVTHEHFPAFFHDISALALALNAVAMWQRLRSRSCGCART